MTPLDSALDFIRRGWAPIPVPYKSKRPVGNAWQTLVIDASNASQYFNGARQNIGVLLGKRSNKLTDVDLDCPEAILLADEFLPSAKAEFGRASKLRSHRLYVTDLSDTELDAAIRYCEPRASGGAALLELRIGANGKGAQTIFPGSTHQSGEEVTWNLDGEPERVDGEQLKRRVALLAGASLLVRHWPPVPGSRHDMALTLGGVLARAGWPETDIERYVSLIACAAGDNEHRERGTSAASAVGKLAQRLPTRGLPSLESDFGRLVANRLVDWLGLKDAFPQVSRQQQQSAPPPPPPPPPSGGPSAPGVGRTPPQALADARATFNKWLGSSYDMALMDLTASVGVGASRPGKNKFWLMIVLGSGGAKSVTVQSLAGAGAVSVSSVTSEAALLGLRRGGGTAGLLPEASAAGGIIAIKEFGALLSMDRAARPKVLNMIREAHDGATSRRTGFDAARILTWRGQVAIAAGCTSAWDAAYEVISQLGDRFGTVRGDTEIDRATAGLQALGNTGKEATMERELAVAMGALVASADPNVRDLTDDENAKLVGFADVVTRVRTAVERDFRGDVLSAHAPEAATRFASQLANAVRSGWRSDSILRPPWREPHAAPRTAFLRTGGACCSTCSSIRRLSRI